MDKKEILSKDLETQWKDHFHMRDQMWKTIQYGVLFFVGVVGLDISKNTNINLVILAYIALFLTSILGFIVVLHLRKRQKEKFRIIRKFEEELEIFSLIADIVKKSKQGLFGKIDTSLFILFIHVVLFVISSVSLYFHIYK